MKFLGTNITIGSKKPHCISCTHWTRDKFYKTFGRCALPNMPTSDFDASGIILDDNCSGAEILFGENFGCIQHPEWAKQLGE